MTELDKLEKYLQGHGYKYDRYEHFPTKEERERAYGSMSADAAEKYLPYLERHQIVVYNDKGRRMWDAVCHKGSYGYEHGLLEVMGDPVVKKTDGDRGAGFLTAEDVIRRLEENHGT